eukprot:TRINITY_DN11728_c0_g1_i3.p1 TRINITY_DN11728_c0_g1~~TRINITY_DN11728_c0_g1_i3.p1  ORF type:complete len:149 (-),score=4.11 TRINITY_DN11728_c0_g1_i3:15-461(-)
MRAKALQKQQKGQSNRSVPFLLCVKANSNVYSNSDIFPIRFSHRCLAGRLLQRLNTLQHLLVKLRVRGCDNLGILGVAHKEGDDTAEHSAQHEQVNHRGDAEADDADHPRVSCVPEANTNRKAIDEHHEVQHREDEVVIDDGGPCTLR